MGKKIKVLPAEDAANLSSEEKEQARKNALVKETAKFLNDGHMRKLCRAYHIDMGLLPGKICRAIPSPIRSLSPTIFGNPKDRPLKGMPAALLRLLELNPLQVRWVKHCFNKIDEDSSGHVTIGEFAAYFQAEDNALFRKLLRATLMHDLFLDRDRNKHTGSSIDVGEFVMCTYTHDQILYRLFKMFDRDGSGYIEYGEMVEMGESVQSMSNEGAYGGNAATFVETMDANKDGVMDFDEFVGLNKEYPMVFWPAMKIQDMLRKRTLGVDAWLAIIDKWDAKEKARAEILGRRPIPLVDNIEKLGGWYEEQKAAIKNAKIKQKQKIIASANLVKKQKSKGKS